MQKAKAKLEFEFWSTTSILGHDMIFLASPAAPTTSSSVPGWPAFATALRKQEEEGWTYENSITEYEVTMNEFSQRFLVAAWEESDNFVFSPFSLHLVLAILTMFVTDNSDTQYELLQAFGRSRNIINIELSYARLTKQYKNSSVIHFGNRLWTTKKYFNLVEHDYFRKIKNIYNADMKFFDKENPESYINDWANIKKNGKINKIIGKNKDFGLN